MTKEEMKKIFQSYAGEDVDAVIMSRDDYDRQMCELQDKYIKALEVAQDRFDRIQKAIEYIETIRDNTPSSTRKDFTKMILINYEQLLDILKGSDKQ